MSRGVLITRHGCAAADGACGAGTVGVVHLQTCRLGPHVSMLCGQASWQAYGLPPPLPFPRPSLPAGIGCASLRQSKRLYLGSLFAAFKHLHPNIRIGPASFKLLQPAHVKKLICPRAKLCASLWSPAAAVANNQEHLSPLPEPAGGCSPRPTSSSSSSSSNSSSPRLMSSSSPRGPPSRGNGRGGRLPRLPPPQHSSRAGTAQSQPLPPQRSGLAVLAALLWWRHSETIRRQPTPSAAAGSGRAPCGSCSSGDRCPTVRLVSMWRQQRCWATVRASNVGASEHLWVASVWVRKFTLQLACSLCASCTNRQLVQVDEMRRE